jgi:hypothetical protein
MSQPNDFSDVLVAEGEEGVRRLLDNAVPFDTNGPKKSNGPNGRAARSARMQAPLSNGATG